jgi:hypothetical protein
MKKYKFTLDQLKEFANYIVECLSFLIADEGTFCGLIHFHLSNLRHKTYVGLLKFQLKNQQTVQVSFDYGELLTLSYCFKQRETPSFLKGIEFNLIGGL